MRREPARLTRSVHIGICDFDRLGRLPGTPRAYVRAAGPLAEQGSPGPLWFVRAFMAFADGAACVPGLEDHGKEASTTACDGYTLKELGIGDRRWTWPQHDLPAGSAALVRRVG